jgi:hypothetical protein
MHEQDERRAQLVAAASPETSAAKASAIDDLEHEGGADAKAYYKVVDSVERNRVPL